MFRTAGLVGWWALAVLPLSAGLAQAVLMGAVLPAEYHIDPLTYKKEWANADHGALRAPFDGSHGWYLQNNAGEPVAVRLRLGGFYEMRANTHAAE